MQCGSSSGFEARVWFWLGPIANSTLCLRAALGLPRSKQLPAGSIQLRRIKEKAAQCLAAPRKMNRSSGGLLWVAWCDDRELLSLGWRPGAIARLLWYSGTLYNKSKVCPCRRQSFRGAVPRLWNEQPQTQDQPKPPRLLLQVPSTRL